MLIFLILFLYLLILIYIILTANLKKIIRPAAVLVCIHFLYTIWMLINSLNGFPIYIYILIISAGLSIIAVCLLKNEKFLNIIKIDIAFIILLLTLSLVLRKENLFSINDISLKGRIWYIVSAGHIILTGVAYSFLLFSGLLDHFYLLLRRRLKKKYMDSIVKDFPSLESILNLNMYLTVSGILFFIFGIFSGALVQLHSTVTINVPHVRIIAALIIIIIFIVKIFALRIKKYRGRKSSIIGIIGVILIIILLLGFDFHIKDYHSFKRVDSKQLR